MVVVLLIMIGQYTKIQGLKAALAEEQTARVVAEANAASLRGAVEEQNKRIEALRVDKEANERALEEWRSKKPEVRYKTVVEHVNIGVKSDECEDIKNMLDGIKRTSF